MISYWDDQYNFLFDRWFSRSAMSLDCKDCYFPYCCSYLNIILCSPIIIHYKVSYTRSCAVGWKRQLSTSPSHIDFHFSNYCLKPIMDIGKFLNFFCESYFGPFSLTSINFKKKSGEECDGDQSVPVGRSGRAGHPSRPEVPRSGRARNDPPSCWTSYVKSVSESKSRGQCERRGHRGSADLRGRVLWPSQWFDILLIIPDPRFAFMVCCSAVQVWCFCC